MSLSIRIAAPGSYTELNDGSITLSDITRVGPKVSGLTYKSSAKWKMRGIHSAVYGEVNVSVCVEIKGEYIEK